MNEKLVSIAKHIEDAMGELDVVIKGTIEDVGGDEYKLRDRLDGYVDTMKSLNAIYYKILAKAACVTK